MNWIRMNWMLRVVLLAAVFGCCSLVALPAFAQFPTTCAGQIDADYDFLAGMILNNIPTGLIVSDFDENGTPDVAVLSAGNAVPILLGNGNGTFAPPVEVAVGNPVRDVVHADVTGDGLRDLVVGCSNGFFVIAAGNGAGVFTVTQTTFAGTPTGHIAVGDVTGVGGFNDLVVHAGINSAGVGTIAVYPGSATGLGTPIHQVTTQQPDRMVITDMNADGNQDLVIGDLAALGTIPGQLLLHVNDGLGNLSLPVPIISGYSGYFRVAHLNGDALPDLLVVAPSGVTVCGTQLDTYLGGPSSVYTYQQTFVGGCGPYAPIAEDLDGDGDVDLAYTDGGDFAAIANFLTIAPGNGTGQFGPTCEGVTGLVWTLGPFAFPDLNGDGRRDLVATTLSLNQVVSYLGVPNGTQSDHVRGDCNADGSFNIADAISLLGSLFPTPGTPPVVVPCDDACDANDDGNLNLADAVSALAALFGTPTQPLDPPSTCGVDPTADSLGCVSFAACP